MYFAGLMLQIGCFCKSIQCFLLEFANSGIFISLCNDLKRYAHLPRSGRQLKGGNPSEQRNYHPLGRVHIYWGYGD